MTTEASFRERYGPWAVVAGGSDGTGAAFARELARRGVDVAIVARRAPLLEALATELRDEFGVDARAVVVDLAAPDASDTLAAATDGLEVGLLAYNAGADERMAPFLGVDVDAHVAMLQRNCVTVLRTVHHFGAPMVARGRGGAVLVTSGAAWAGGSHLAVYGATKAFDLVLGEALWAEWREHGVDVLSLVLGPTETPSYRNLLDRHGRDAPPGADPTAVVAEALDHLADGPTWTAGSPDPGGGSPFGSLPRRQAVELMSQGARALLPDQATDDAS